MQVGRRPEVGGDAVDRQYVKEVLTDAGIDIASRGILGRDEAVVAATVVAPTVAGVARAHLGHLSVGGLCRPSASDPSASDSCIVTGATVPG
jgi:hypothetical protein